MQQATGRPGEGARADGAAAAALAAPAARAGGGPHPDVGWQVIRAPARRLERLEHRQELLGRGGGPIGHGVHRRWEEDARGWRFRLAARRMGCFAARVDGPAGSSAARPVSAGGGGGVSAPGCAASGRSSGVRCKSSDRMGGSGGRKPRSEFFVDDGRAQQRGRVGDGNQCRAAIHRPIHLSARCRMWQGACLFGACRSGNRQAPWGRQVDVVHFKPRSQRPARASSARPTATCNSALQARRPHRPLRPTALKHHCLAPSSTRARTDGPVPRQAIRRGLHQAVQPAARSPLLRGAQNREPAAADAPGAGCRGPNARAVLELHRSRAGEGWVSARRPSGAGTRPFAAAVDRRRAAAASRQLAAVPHTLPALSALHSHAPLPPYPPAASRRS
jgi:hypothetical protein